MRHCSQSFKLRTLVATGCLAFVTVLCSAAATAGGDNGDIVGINANALTVMNKNPALGQKVLGLLSDSGAKWVRIGASWNSLEPTSGNYQWSKLDAIVSAIRDRQLNILLTVARTPCWAREDLTQTCALTPTKQKHVGSEIPNLQAWQAFIRDLVLHYRGKVRYFEIWNEPNSAAAINVEGGKDNSVALLTAYRDKIMLPAAEAAHKADSSAQVVAPALGMAGFKSGAMLSEALSEVLGNGAAREIDVISIHVYASHDLFAYAAAAHAQMNKLGIGDKPLWLTEFGITADRAKGEVTTDTLAQQSDFASKALARNASEHAFGKMFWYALGDNNLFGSDWQSGRMYGLVDNDLKARPAYRVLQKFTQKRPQ